MPRVDLFDIVKAYTEHVGLFLQAELFLRQEAA
jgi:hypothetical protein